VEALTSPVNQSIHELARRFGFSDDAVAELFGALIRGNAIVAQFNHPELGGMGQWMRDGTTVGNSTDPNLKGRIEGLCAELSKLVIGASFQTIDPDATGPQQWSGVDSGSPYLEGSDVGDGVVLPANPLAPSWWPEELGHPAATGSQGEIRYAYFPESNRLVILDRGDLTIHNTLGHHLTGLAQQGPGSVLTFTTPGGALRVSDLPVISITGD
jgi:hypothetical protein